MPYTSWIATIRNPQGNRAEQAAQRFLAKQGLTLIARNYAWRGGELDLVMKDTDTLVFIEVRYRAQDGFGSSAESITWQKQQKLIRTAQHFLQQHRLTDKSACRFDIITAKPDSSRRGTLQIGWIKNAFSA
ncbi:YraN family protein [Kistimonas asteriae]|uniref:YraN family protein n=1 Tax=Kistimonas asteriae TaxID=517724 RepID=UPI001BA8971B|nr:YraN family protein [Kistimonas asteriae]